MFEKLKISLTKFGYHKIVDLVKTHGNPDVFNHLDDQEGDKIDDVQARKILSEYYTGNFPDLWKTVQTLGRQDIQDIIYVAIIFSHHRLIDLFKDISKKRFVLNRDNSFIAVKEYTNFVRTSYELGFIKEEDFNGAQSVVIDLTRLYHKPYIPGFIANIIRLKIIDAEIKGIDFLKIIESEELNDVFGLTGDEFKVWISSGIIDLDVVENLNKNKIKTKYKKGVKFTAGHNPKFEGIIPISASSKPVVSTLIHNRIQTKVYEILNERFPGQIGTENPSNNGSIDIVRFNGKNYTFYEIKTATSIRISIRQAISQLLEYAYWSNIENVYQLIIIAPNKVDEEAQYYLGRLRQLFGLPLYYQYFEEDTNTLHDPV